MTQSGATTPSQSRPGSDCNKGVLCITQISYITEVFSSYCFVLYQRHSLEEDTKMHSVYSAVPADKVILSSNKKYYLRPYYQFFFL